MTGPQEEFFTGPARGRLALRWNGKRCPREPAKDHWTGWLCWVPGFPRSAPDQNPSQLAQLNLACFFKSLGPGQTPGIRAAGRR